MLLALALLLAALAVWAVAPGQGRLIRLDASPSLPRTGWAASRIAAVTRVRSDRGVLVTDLILMLELLADALDAGAPPVTALETVASALGGTLSTPLRQAATAMRLGADARSAWHDVTLASAGGPLAETARAMSRIDEGGARVAASLRRLATREAERAHGRALAAARRAGVIAVAPLGFCFLPAFVLLAVIPVVAGAAHHVLLP
jgi:pilus assembly protein TadC